MTGGSGERSVIAFQERYDDHDIDQAIKSLSKDKEMGLSFTDCDHHGDVVDMVIEACTRLPIPEGCLILDSGNGQSGIPGVPRLGTLQTVAEYESAEALRSRSRSGERPLKDRRGAYSDESQVY